MEEAAEGEELSRPAGGDERLWPALTAVAAAGSLPYVSLLAANVGEMLELDRILSWWGTTLGAGLAVLAVAGLGGRRHVRWAGSLAGIALLLFFHYPGVTGLREVVRSGMSDLRWWSLVTVLVLAIAIPLTRTAPVQLFLGIWLPALLLLPLFELLTSGPADADPGPTGVEQPAITFQHEPNVYWFVLDGLAGPPFLRDELGVDTGPFLDRLRRQGFGIQEQATSNYPVTHLAIPSALEMEYLYEGVEEPAADPFLKRLRGDNRTVDTFLANGYRYVHAFPGLWQGSRCSGREDLCLGEHGPVGETGWALASATPLIERLTDGETARSVAVANDPLHLTEAVLDADPESPFFAFIHLINPHPPYLRDRACRLRDIPLTLSAWGGGSEYAAAVTCLLDRLEAAVGRILAVDEDPVIIIQGDHGPRLGLSSSTSGAVLLDDEMHFSALSAIRLPAACADRGIPDDLTFVNTFRVVFGCLGDEAPQLLPDRHFPIRREY